MSSKSHWFSLFPRELLWEEEARRGAARAQLPAPALLPTGLFFMLLTPNPAKMSGQGCSRLLGWAFSGGAAFPPCHSCLSPPRCWDPSCAASLGDAGGWKRWPWGPGYREEGEEEHGPPSAAMEDAAAGWVPERAGAQMSLGNTTPASPPVVLALQPFAKLVLLARHPARVLAIVAASAAAGHQVHHAAWAMSGPWGAGVWPAKFCCWKKTCAGLLLAEAGNGRDAKSLWQPTV